MIYRILDRLQDCQIYSRERELDRTPFSPDR
jgi:hypothetical protein